MARTNKHNNKKAKSNKASTPMTTSEERFTQLYPNMINFMCDNRNGGGARNDAMREYMQKPEVASAFYQFLMNRDVSNFDPDAPCPLPPATAALLREHFPGHHV